MIEGYSPRLLEGCVVALTGAARGIGRALALGLSRHGAVIAACDRDETGLAETVALVRAAGGLAAAFAMDITSVSDVARSAEAVGRELGAVSVLVNNAGVMMPRRIDSDDFAATLEASLRVNVEGMMHVTRAFLAPLRATRGRIVNVASTSAFLATAGSTSYGATKAAVIQITRTLAVELGPEGIRVNAIAPGAVIDPNGETMSAAELAPLYIRRTPTRRVCAPEDMVGPVAFLASSLSTQVTGTVLPVDGGYLAMGMVFD